MARRARRSQRTRTNATDITVYSAIGWRRAPCSGNGIVLRHQGPRTSEALDAVNESELSYCHRLRSRTMAPKSCLPTMGRRLGARCRSERPEQVGRGCHLPSEGRQAEFRELLQLPAAQGDSENCVAHNGSLIPVPAAISKRRPGTKRHPVVDFNRPRRNPSRLPTSIAGR